MGWHTAKQIDLPGGLGKKMEDWLEAQHQEGTLIRKQYKGAQESKNIEQYYLYRYVNGITSDYVSIGNSCVTESRGHY